MKFPQWYFDQVSLEHATGMGIPKPRKLAQPAFMDKSAAPLRRTKSKPSDSAALTAQAWKTAMSPLKQLPITIISTYFSGDSIQIVVLTLIFYGLLVTPLWQILTVSSAFKGLKKPSNSNSITRAKLVYILTNFLALWFGIYKVNSMGMLPTRQIDWLAWETPTVYQEYLN